MKALLAFLYIVAGQAAMAAAPVCVEAIECRSEPSSYDWWIIYAARMSDGTIACAWYSAPPPDEAGKTRAARKVRKAKDISLSREQFDALASAIEGAGLRAEAEAHDGIGLDGEVLVFWREKAGRKVELRFWNPRESSEAAKLREEFHKILGLQPALRQHAGL